MRTPLWETSPGALVALLNARGPLNKADLYTLTLSDGTAYRWCGYDLPLSGNGQTWQLGPGLKRTGVRTAIGTSSDDLTITVTDNRGTLINGQKLMAFIRAGGVAKSWMQVDKVFWGPSDAGPVGALMWFAGQVSVPGGDRFSAQLTVQCDLIRLAVQVPTEVYRASCRNFVYNSLCGVRRESFTETATATGGTDATRTTFAHTMPDPAGWFGLGTIEMTSGANAGVYRTVKTHSPTLIEVLMPWPFPVAVGDTFKIVPGCDGTQATCASKFNNVINFRGLPYIPVPETVL